MPSNDDADSRSARRRRMIEAGEWLRETRARRGFTARALAAAVGVDPSVISNYERGVNAVDDDRAQQIADALDLDVVEARRGLGLWVPGDTAPAVGDTVTIYVRNERERRAVESLLDALRSPDPEDPRERTAG